MTRITTRKGLNQSGSRGDTLLKNRTEKSLPIELSIFGPEGEIREDFIDRSLPFRTGVGTMKPTIIKS
ncbi:MAG: hypothetical protein IPL72_13140 [Sulfuritalea sp.]|nr:hypothetical protein [Sulfuritalea sp.]